MEVDWDKEVCGMRLLLIRDMLRTFRGKVFREAAIEERLRVSASVAAHVAEILLNDGWIQRTANQTDSWFELTGRGRQFAAATASPRISRAKAEKILSEFIIRVHEVNDDDNYGVYVSSAYIFGSYLDASKDQLGDIDLDVTLRPRPIIGRDYWSYCAERQELAGATGWFHDFLEHEVKRYIRNRSPYLSIAPGGISSTLGIETRLIFQAADQDRLPRDHRRIADHPGGQGACKRVFGTTFVA